MSAATQARLGAFRSTGKQPIVGFVQKAGTVIYKGTAVGHVAGVFQPVASGVSGLVFAGFAEGTYDCSDEGADYTWPSNKPMIFHRHARALDIKSGDAVTAADLGTLVPFDDDQTVKHTAATHDVTARLLEIEGSLAWVEPQ